MVAIVAFGVLEQAMANNRRTVLGLAKVKLQLRCAAQCCARLDRTVVNCGDQSDALLTARSLAEHLQEVQVLCALRVVGNSLYPTFKLIEDQHKVTLADGGDHVLQVGRPLVAPVLAKLARHECPERVTGHRSIGEFVNQHHGICRRRPPIPELGHPRGCFRRAFQKVIGEKQCVRFAKAFHRIRENCPFGCGASKATRQEPQQRLHVFRRIGQFQKPRGVTFDAV